MNIKKYAPLCVYASPCPSSFLAALGLIIILAVIVPPAAFGVVYVNKDATGANDGSSWADAYSRIQAGIDDADVSDDEVWVGQGTYYEAILMKSGVALYGGFNGTETSRSERNWTTNVTTIDASTAHRWHPPVYHVVTMSHISNSRVDGFTITGGNANGGYTDDCGGGIYCDNVGQSSIIANNVIVGNSAYHWGGGIFCESSLPIITKNTILRNSARWGGGGIYCGWYSSSAITNNTITGNSTDWYGGAIYCEWHSSPTIMNNIIMGNSAGSWGGAISCYKYSSPTITNNTISDNSVSGTGGAIDCSGSSSPVITNNRIAGNSAHDGGGILCYHLSSPAIMNNIIVGNSAIEHGGGIHCSFYSSAKISNNLISGNLANLNGGGVFCCLSSPPITNTIFSNNNRYDIYEDDTYSDPIVEYNDFYNNADGVYYDEESMSYALVSAMDAAIPECSNNMGLDPLFVGDTLSAGTWTTTTIYNSSILQTTLTNASARWIVNEHAGRLLNPDTSQNKQFAIVNNAATTINVWSDVTEIAEIGDSYKIFDYHLQPISPCNDAGCYIEGLTQDFEGDPRPWDGTGEPRGDGSDFDIGADEFTGLWHDFASSQEGWTTGTAVVFTAPQWVFEPGRLKLVAENNTNTFGYWVSPENAVPVNEGYLYRARFTVSTDVTMPELVPQIRIRVNSSNFQQADCITIDSNGDGSASPTPEGTIYDLYFVPPTNDQYCMLAFDLLNFNTYDAAHAELALESVLVERFRLDTLDGSTTINWTYDFETSQEFWLPGDGTFTFTDPEFFWDDGALHLRSMTNTNTFGYWHNDPIDIIVEEDRLYRGTFEVRTDETDPGRVPQMRLRFNTANMQAARSLEITSIGDGANSPATTITTYDRLYFLPPANCVGNGLIVSFDILNFNPEDAPGASLILDRAIIETLSPTALP